MKNLNADGNFLTTFKKEVAALAELKHLKHHWFHWRYLQRVLLLYVNISKPLPSLAFTETRNSVGYQSEVICLIRRSSTLISRKGDQGWFREYGILVFLFLFYKLLHFIKTIISHLHYISVSEDNILYQDMMASASDVTVTVKPPPSLLSIALLFFGN